MNGCSRASDIRGIHFCCVFRGASRELIRYVSVHERRTESTGFQWPLFYGSPASHIDTAQKDPLSQCLFDKLAHQFTIRTPANQGNEGLHDLAHVLGALCAGLGHYVSNHELYFFA
jgi:hypothetical protein